MKLSDRGWKVPFVRKSLFQIGKDLRPKIDRLIMRHSLLPDQAIIEKDYFPWIDVLERNWEHIRDEAVRIRTQEIPSLGEISPDHGRIAADRRWRSFFLEGYGYRRAENCARAPFTASLLDRIPNLVTACFSVLEAGCHIPRHYGMTKGMLTYHLALQAPTDRANCHINIEGPDRLHVISWENGNSFMFDDMYNHEVWNDTSEDRYILLIQVQRPCRGVARLIQNFFLFCVRHSRFVQDIKRQLDHQADRHHAPA
ncbi:aspartyl/asparaginyl beta-hydroxylase domain-containing protein [Novacetimonas pomaceti]|uniref:Aspartyl beta-hydroxylase n=1 Tax=Novacetimonas pomaceti TaxID=2021998 RepID=A0A318QS73_9PROT|nr:aspartyl/asparaginyl beta-hydroxylase domain-containing protein [Novacetimonas pomaceti]PYD49241.1 aspartyl/asparaginyl beta-hydroxylase domain-containing protein [Novacetimonas pomaceti]PYD75563.1 aspartyl beta-hydroxylase [Novacetimonas pomaceti]